MERRLKDWLTGYLKFCEDSEPPQAYHIWTGMSVLAGALQRRVYMKWGRSTIYPNLYIVLVGPSGRAKKGTALEYGKPFIKGVGAKVIEGAITREKLIRRMGESIMPIPDRNITRMQCAVTYVSGELSVFLGQNNIRLLADLCDWYDCPGVWTYDTKGQGTDILEGLCFNLLGATAPDWIPSILPKEAVGGGFTSRVIWIVEEDKRETVIYPTIDTKLEDALKEDLERVFLINGEFEFDDEAFDLYGKWYKTEDQRIRDGKPPIYDPKFAGYCDRRATLIKKLSMIVSASESNETVVNVNQFQRALQLMELAEKKMARTFAGLGSARYAYASEQLMNYIVKHGTVTRTQVLRFFFRDIDEYTFDVVVRSLAKAGIISVTIPKDSNEVVLKLEKPLKGGGTW